MSSYNVAYDAPDGPRTYCQMSMTLEQAGIYLEKFKALYVGKPYPNGKGFYPFTNPRVVETPNYRGRVFDGK